jgi:ABC-type transport system involved in multi-copper enzyme maturation permease subunit
VTDAPITVDDTVVVREPGSLASFWASISAVFTRESRWRMRGRRAFVVATAYVSLVSLLVFAVYRVMYDQALFQAQFQFEGGPSGFVSGTISAQIGQAIFGAILVLQTVLTLMVAPALTSGAISGEREKGTLELLITTPASTFGLVVGKLVSSLAFVFVLIAASVPLMSVVFAFGGLAPDDLIRAYVLLFAVAFGIGAIGLAMSALTKRTQMATVVSYIIVLVLTVGTLIVHSYWTATSAQQGGAPDQMRINTAPQALMWLNPLAADLDVVCTATPESYGFACAYISVLTSGQFNAANPGRDTFWPISAAAFVALGVALALLTTQLISPTRRIRRRVGDRAGEEPAIEEPASEVPAIEEPQSGDT